MTALSFVVVLSFVTLIFVNGFSATFNLLLINPLINALIILDRVVGGNFGLAIILFTVLLRVVTLPLTMNQYRSMKNMQAAQPVIQELQKKYKDPKRRQEEMAKVYREFGINPLGCLAPMLIQFGVFAALYRALAYTVGGNPESLVGLSRRLYDWSFLRDGLPLDQHFLWLDLGKPDGTLILPVLVFVTTYVQQKVSQTPNPNPQQAQQQQMMTWMMPLVITSFMLNLASGVGVYWVVSNIFSLFQSYYVYGREFDWRKILPIPLPPPEPGKGSAGRRQPDTAPSTGTAIRGDGGANDETTTEEPAGPAPQEKARTPHGRKRRGKRKDRR
ncbi:MAG TPA: YidC/Oxa1 family membrane protein insertase [Dehalococcoidia bacterium]|nr:YidC/Oxa1 family membrane protein insertase [Dehalococcoidia bacterium]